MPTATNSELFEEAHSLEGTATQEQKETILHWLQLVCGWFAGDVSRKIRPIRLDIGIEAGMKQGTLVSEVTVDKDMTNGYGTMHGGCSALFVDVHTSVLLAAFHDAHVSLNLNVDFHQPMPLGTTIRIISTTRAIGKRVLSTKCEFYHKEKGTLLLSGTHTKMPPSMPPVSKL